MATIKKPEPLGSLLNPIGNVVQPQMNALQSSQAFKGVPKEQSQSVAKTAPATLPKLGFGGVSTVQQFYPETGTTISPEVMKKAKEIAPTFRQEQQVQEYKATQPVQQETIVPKAQASESIDTNIAQQAISDIQAGMPMEEFDSIYPELSMSKSLFEQYAMDIQAGMPAEEAPKFYPELFGGVAQEEQKQGKTAIQALGESLKDSAGVIGTALAAPIVEAPRILGNIVGAASDIGGFVMGDTPEQRKAASDIVRKPAEELTAKGEKIFAPESIGTVRAATDIGTSAMIPGGVLKSGVGLGQGIVRGAAQGAIETAKYTGVSEGRLPTAQEAGVGGLIGGSLPVVGAGLKSVSGKIAQNLQVSGLVRPNALKKVNEQLASEGVESGVRDINAAGKWMLNRNVKGNEDQIISQLDDIGKASKGKVDETFEYVDDISRSKNETVKNILTSLKAEYQGSISSTGKQKLSRVNELLKKETKIGLSLKEKNEVKRMIDSPDLSPYGSTGKVKISQSDLAGARSDLKKTIEEEAIELADKIDNPQIAESLRKIKSLNKETQVANTLKRAITDKGETTALRELVTAFAPTATAGGLVGGWAGPSPTEDPWGFLKSVIGGAAVGATLGSVKFKTNVANKLSKLDPSEIKLLNAYIESRGGTKLPDGIIKKVKEGIKGISSKPK